MIFYSTKLTDSERSPHIQEFFRESFPMFSSCEAAIKQAFLLLKYFRSLVFSGKFPHLHSTKLRRRNRGSEDFLWHPDKNFGYYKGQDGLIAHMHDFLFN